MIIKVNDPVEFDACSLAWPPFLKRRPVTSRGARLLWISTVPGCIAASAYRLKGSLCSLWPVMSFKSFAFKQTSLGFVFEWIKRTLICLLPYQAL